MKKAILLLLLAFAGSFCFASEDLDMYTWLFKQSNSIVERYSILRGAAEAKLSDGGSLYSEALSQLLVEYSSLRDNAEKQTAIAEARLLANQLGEAKYMASANDLWRLSEAIPDPLVRADAYVALGQMRSPEQLPKIVRILADLNLQPAADRDAAEKVAFGAIIALEKYRDLSGYAPVFFAANGWYSGRVKNQAVATLPLLVDDPTDSLVAIINSNGYDIKLLALQRSDEAKAPDARKAEVALLAMNEGWSSATSDKKEKGILALLRKQASKGMAKYGVPDAAISLLDRCYREGFDMEEKLLAIETLSTSRSDDAAVALASFLKGLNEKQKAGGLTPDDEKLVRAVIPAIGKVGKMKGSTPLKAIEFMDWPPAIKTMASEALKKLK